MRGCTEGRSAVLRYSCFRQQKGSNQDLMKTYYSNCFAKTFRRREVLLFGQKSAGLCTETGLLKIRVHKGRGFLSRKCLQQNQDCCTVCIAKTLHFVQNGLIKRHQTNLRRLDNWVFILVFFLSIPDGMFFFQKSHAPAAAREDNCDNCFEAVCLSWRGAQNSLKKHTTPWN